MVFTIGDSVRIDIPDSSDPDFEYHRKIGTVVERTEDDLSGITGDERDDYQFKIEFDESEETAWFRWRDLRPAGGENRDESTNHYEG